MRCPVCRHPNSAVKDSRPVCDGDAIRRRRMCLGPSCGARFTTHERVTLRELVVIKRSGRRVPFDQDKLARSINIAVASRPIEPGVLHAAISRIVRCLESMGETEINSTDIGELVMAELKVLDDVAFIRYASVYRVFMHAADFAAFLAAEELA